MTTPNTPIDLSHLSPADRIHLVQDLWDSIHDDAMAVPLSKERNYNAATLTWNPVPCGGYPGKK
jgi:Putative addiction module component